MSPQKRRPQARKGRTAAAASKGGRKTDRTALIAAIVIIAVGGSLVFAFAKSASNKNKKSEGDQPASATLVKQITGIPDSVIQQVGPGTASPLPAKLPGPPLTKNGKPVVLYIGAEYCPYSATERWAMVNALSRFGTFKGLQITQSAGGLEAYPNTQTLSFHGSTYASPYISLQTVETEDNQKKPLEQATSEQAQLQAKWDNPPYVDAKSANAIPFINFANQYLISGASYNPGVLTGKSHDEIAAGMNDGNSDIAKGAVGTANVMTATICLTTHNKPANVCTTPAIAAIQQSITHQAG